MCKLGREGRAMDEFIGGRTIRRFEEEPPEPIIPELVRPAFGCGVPNCPHEPRRLYFGGGRPYVLCASHAREFDDRRQGRFKWVDQWEPADLFEVPDDWRARIAAAVRSSIRREEAVIEQKYRSIATYQHSLDRARAGLREAEEKRDAYQDLLSELGEELT